MSKIRNKIRTKQLSQGSVSTQNIKQAFRNENGAIDLASIMVGIIVIGLIGGVIAATVFAVIPWSQDNAAKHQLDSIVAAQSAYMGLSSDSPPALPAGHKANSFADSDSLASAGLLQVGSTYCAVITDDGKGYQGLSQSASGKVWSVLDTNTKPANLGQGSIAPDCSFIEGGVTDENGSETDNEDSAESPYVDPTPTKTILTYKCDITQTGQLSMRDNLTGILTVIGDDNSKIETAFTNSLDSGNVRMLAGVTYKVTFDGTYEQFNQGTSNLSSCVRSLDHWGQETRVSNASSGLAKATNLTSVPEHIPSSITSMISFFENATSINDPNISKWDVSNIDNFSRMFQSTTFNQPLNDWEMSNASTISSMFALSKYDLPLDKWDVSNVEKMEFTFSSNRSFNQPLNTWNVSNVLSMRHMFSNAREFNQPLDSWNVSKVSDMSYMFDEAHKFDQPIGIWKPTKVTTVEFMFDGTLAFNQNLSAWTFDVKPSSLGFTPPTFPKEYKPYQLQ